MGRFCCYKDREHPETEVMKKAYILVAVVLGAAALAACSNSHNNTSASDSTRAAAVQQAIDQDSPIAIVDNHIIPVDDYGTVVDFYADWCPPCKKLKPIFDEFKQKYEGRLNFVTINVDQYQNLASTYNVSNIPTLLFISRDGKELGRMVGLHAPEEIDSQLHSYFPEDLK